MGTQEHSIELTTCKTLLLSSVYYMYLLSKRTIYMFCSVLWSNVVMITLNRVGVSDLHMKW